MTDLELVEGTLAGRRRDFEELVERHQRMLYAVAARYLKDTDAADEVVQATFVRAFTRLAQFRQVASFRTWLCGILINECRANRRRARARQEVALDAAPESALIDASDPTRSAERAAIERHVERLPPRQRSVVSLRVFADLPFREIAALEGISENAAKVNYHHAIARLREWLTDRD